MEVPENKAAENVRTEGSGLAITRAPPANQNENVRTEGSGLPITQAAPANQNENVRTEGSGLPIIQAAPANQNDTNNILHEKPEDWPPCLAQSLSLGCTVQGC